MKKSTYVRPDYVARPKIENLATDILRQAHGRDIVPIMCADLTNLALTKLGVTRTKENMALHGTHIREAAITGNHPQLRWLNGLVFLAEWLEPVDTQMRMFPWWRQPRLSGVITFDVMLNTVARMSQRIQYMKNKYDVPPHVHMAITCKGGTIEQHVSDYFRVTWPELWKPASNAHAPTQAAPDDFRLQLSNRLLLIDVTTSSLPDRFRPLQKMFADAHILATCDAKKNQWDVHGWCTNQELAQGIDIDNARSLNALILKINIDRIGVSLESLRQAVDERRPLKQRPAVSNHYDNGPMLPWGDSGLQ